MHTRRVSMEWRAEDGGLEHRSQQFLLCCVAGVASRAGQTMSWHEMGKSWASSSTTSPAVQAAHRYPAQSTSHASTAAGRRETWASRGAAHPSPAWGTSRYRDAAHSEALAICCASWDELQITCGSQEGLKTSAKCSWKSRLLWLHDSPAAPRHGSCPLPEQALPGALCFAFLPPRPSEVKTPWLFLRACHSLVDGFAWESKATEKLAGNK